jgi:RNA polymerase sigma factor (sigma-70 family)
VLNDKEKAVIELQYFGGLPQQQIATILDISRDSVKTVRQRAINKMRGFFNQKES